VVGLRPALASLVASRALHPVGPDAPLGVLGETRPRSQSLGLYIHVPFCAKRCYYCSFNTTPLDSQMVGRFLAALGSEIEMLGSLPWASDIAIETIFFGGGTPSLLEAEQLAAILDDVRAR